MPQSKLLYVETPKVACTSIKHALMRVDGRDPATVVSDKAEVSQTMTVHDRHIWRLPSLLDLSPAQRASALNGTDGWFSFAVVRDPFERVVSLWTQKVLLSDPTSIKFGIDPYPVEPGGPAVELRASFDHFIEQLQSNWAHLRTDGHFAPQAEAVRADLVDYSALVLIGEIGDLERRVADHLAGHGIAFPGFKRHNEGLRLHWSDVGSEHVAETIRHLYVEDFTQFELSDATPAFATSSRALTAIETQLLREVRDRNQRIYDLAEIAQSRLGSWYAFREIWRGANKRVREMRSRKG